MQSVPVQRQIVRLEGEFWTIVFDGDTCRLRDTNGVRYLAYLLARPHQNVSSLEIRHAIAPGENGLADAQALERARVNVTRAVSGVMRRLESHHPALSRHLRSTVRTGAYCTYRPDPRVEVGWESADQP